MEHGTTIRTAPVARAYPLIPPRPGDDGPVLSFGLLVDLSDVMIAHGFPRPQGRDFVALRECIAWFTYASDEPGDLRDIEMPDGPPPPLPPGVDGMPVGGRCPQQRQPGGNER